MSNYPITKDTADSLYQATNRARTTLVNGIGPADLALQLTDASLFPLTSFLLSINDEITWCDSRTGNNVVINALGRGWEGTVASTHAAASICSCNITALQRNNLRDTLIDQQNYLWKYRGTAVSMLITTPPVAPNEGDQYVIPATGATGVWAGQGGNLAVWRNAAWQFTTPEDQMSVFSWAETRLIMYDALTTRWHPHPNTVSIWDSTIAYDTGDLTIYQNRLWRSKTLIAVGAPFSTINWQEISHYPMLWSNTYNYFAGDMAAQDGLLWAARIDHVGIEPGTSNATWGHPSAMRVWAAGDQYQINEITLHNNNFWRSLVVILAVNPAPGTDPAVWQRIGPIYAFDPNNPINSGDIVVYNLQVWQAQAGSTALPVPTPGTDRTIWRAAHILPNWLITALYEQFEIVYHLGKLWRSTAITVAGQEPGVHIVWESATTAILLNDLLDVDTTGILKGNTVKYDDVTSAYLPKMPIENWITATPYQVDEMLYYVPTRSLYRVLVSHTSGATPDIDYALGNVLPVTRDQVLDSVFRILDDADINKRLSFTVGNITTGITRQISVPDRNINISRIIESYAGGANYITGDYVDFGNTIYKAIAPINNAPPVFNPPDWTMITPGAGTVLTVHQDPNYYNDQRLMMHENLWHVFIGGIITPFEALGTYEESGYQNGKLSYNQTDPNNSRVYTITNSGTAWEIRCAVPNELYFTSVDNPQHVGDVTGWTPVIGTGVPQINETPNVSSAIVSITGTYTLSRSDVDHNAFIFLRGGASYAVTVPALAGIYQGRTITFVRDSTTAAAVFTINGSFNTNVTTFDLKGTVGQIAPMVWGPGNYWVVDRSLIEMYHDGANIIVDVGLNIKGVTDLDGTLNVDGTVNIEGATTIDDNATVTGDLNVSGSAFINGRLGFGGIPSLAPAGSTITIGDGDIIVGLSTSTPVNTINGNLFDGRIIVCIGIQGNNPTIETGGNIQMNGTSISISNGNGGIMLIYSAPHGSWKALNA